MIYKNERTYYIVIIETDDIYYKETKQISKIS